MKLTVKRLDSGYVIIRGRGPCNWTQPSHWPCSEAEIRSCAHPEASDEFLREALCESTATYVSGKNPQEDA